MGNMSFPITHLLDPADFDDRWKRARMAAQRKALGALTHENEELNLKAVSHEQREDLLRAVFENSKRLGESIRWHFGAEWEISDFYDVISKLDFQCFKGSWKTINEGVVLERAGCDAERHCGSYACDYFKEAMEGLVLGVSNEVTFARHESRGHGSQDCKDLFLNCNADELTFAPLTKELIAILEVVNGRMTGEGVEVTSPGQAEGVLYYSWRIHRGESCRDVSSLVEKALTLALTESLVETKIKDITPRAIIGPGTGSQKNTPAVSKSVKISHGEKRKWNQILS